LTKLKTQADGLEVKLASSKEKVHTDLSAKSTKVKESIEKTKKDTEEAKKVVEKGAEQTEALKAQ